MRHSGKEDKDKDRVVREDCIDESLLVVTVMLVKHIGMSDFPEPVKLNIRIVEVAVNNYV